MVGFPFMAFASFVLSAAAAPGTGDQRMNEPVEIVLERAEAEAKLKGQGLRSLLGDEDSEFAVDLEAGEITFTSETRVITASVQVIGTYNTLDETFLWGWDHPSVPEPLAADARLARRFGQLRDLPLFTTRKIECSEEEAWMFTAVALYLSGAEGSYRAPFGTTMVFMTLGEVSIAPVN